MARGEDDKVILNGGEINTDDVKLLVRILAFEHAKAVARDNSERRPEGEITKSRSRLLSYLHATLSKAGRLDVWNSALDNVNHPTL